MFWIGLSLIFLGLISSGIKALLVLLGIVLIGIIASKCIDRFM